MMTRPSVESRQMASALLVCCALAQAGCGGSAPPGEGSTDGGPTDHLPAGYALRLDRSNRDRANFNATLEEGRLRVDTGPAGILYRPDEVVEGAGYTVRARFTEVGAPMGHREGFGLFIGGQELGGPSQRYIYFLVRGDGRFLVKQRDGDATTELSSGWQTAGAVRVPGSDGGEVTNELAIETDAGGLRLSCNGETVADVTLDATWLDGVVGFRVNHNLSVRIEDFDIERN